MGSEYRVRWRREDRNGASQIFQTHAGALGKIDRLLALEEAKADIAAYATMPDLAGVPVLEYRDVGEWATHPDQPSEASKEVRSEWRAQIHKEHELRGPYPPARYESPVADHPWEIPF